MKARAPKLLIVDDGERYAELAHALLRDYRYATRCELSLPCWECPRREGCRLTHAHDWAETEQALRRHSDIDVVLLDLRFHIPVERLLPSDETRLAERQRLEGLAILRRLRRVRAELPVILMTSVEQLGPEVDEQVFAADEFVSLAGADAFDARALGLLIERTLARRRELGASHGYEWGESPAMARLRRDASTLARTSLPLLILGETGTGKSALAERVIHAESGRKGSFVAVDLAALPETLVAAELFGTAPGAYSGAMEREGRFERAEGGTLLLDEVGNLSAENQRMLLLALQDGRITRLGENVTRKVDVKLVAASNVDLEAEVRAGRFRADLYARLNPAARLTLPPLRQRKEDIESLAQSFLRRTFAAGPDRALLLEYAEAAGLDAPGRVQLCVGKGVEGALSFVLASASLKALRAHPWPGNIRELELLIKSAALLALADAREAIERGRAGKEPNTIPIPTKLLRELLQASWVAPDAEVRTPVPSSMPRGKSLRALAQGLERDLFVRLFLETHGDFVAMAERLLEGDAEENARRVRLRFNQLGLRVRELRSRLEG